MSFFSDLRRDVADKVEEVVEPTHTHDHGPSKFSNAGDIPPVQPVARTPHVATASERAFLDTNATDTGSDKRTGPAIHHRVGPAEPNDPAEVANARALLAQAERDPQLLVDTVRRILESARNARVDVGMQLVELVAPYGHDVPAIAGAARDAAAVLAHRRDAEAHQAQQPHAQAKDPAAAAADRDAWKDQEWVSGDWSNPSYVGHQVRVKTPITKRDVYAALTKVAPSMPHEVKVCMIGQAFTEQTGGDVFNFNFAGTEGGSHAFTNDVWTTAALSVAAYTAQPEPKTDKYRDWTPGNPFGGVWGPPGKKETPRGTIQYQLDHHEDPLIVLTPKERPSYQTLEQACAAFVQKFEYRVRLLQKSGDPKHRELAEKAMEGDAAKYAELINMQDWNERDEHGKPILDSKGKVMAFGAWNGSEGYTGRATASIQHTQHELADLAPEQH